MVERAALVLKVQLLKPGARPPWRGTPGASGWDLFACIEGRDGLILGQDPVLVGTGIALEFSPGYDVQVRPRSGLTRQGVGVALGTIDSDYRGEILITMYCFGSRQRWVIHHGDRIAQLVITQGVPVRWEAVEVLEETARGESGHGSTGR